MSRQPALDPRRSIHVPGPLYRRAQARFGSISKTVVRLLEADLKLWGVSGIDPGMPELPSRAPRPRGQGPREWASVTGLLYRRARAHASTMGRTLTTHVEELLEAELAPDSPSTEWATTETPAAPDKPARPARTAEDERRCESALDELGMSAGGVGFL